MDWYTVISVIVIPFIVQVIKRFIPATWATIAAIIVALVLVVIGKFTGLSLEFGTLLDIIIKALATAGVAVIGYDQFKQITTK